MRYKIIIVLFLIVSLLGFQPQRLISKDLEIQDAHYSVQITHFSKIYGVDEKIVAKVVECESGGDHTANGDGGRSKGIAQFQKPTWDWMSKQYFDEYNEKLNYKSSFDNVKLLAYQISKGNGNNWTSYVAIKKGGTYSFYSKQLNKHFTVKCKL